MKFTLKDDSLGRETKQILRYKSPNLLIKKSDGSLAICNLEKGEFLKAHLFQTFQPHSNIINSKNINLAEMFLNSPLLLSFLSSYLH